MVRYDVSAGVATLTLDRPDKRNALNDATIAGLKEHLARAEDDRAVRVVLLRGAGSDFCAGADLAQLEKIAAGGTPEENRAHAMQFGELLIQMRRMHKPIVAAVHGNALAGGAGLATACDLVIAHEDAVFGYPEVKIGFVPAMVMALLVRIVGETTAFELTAFGNTISAPEAHRLGLVNRVVTGDFAVQAVAYAQELAQRPASAVQLIKQLLYDIDGMSFEQAIAHAADINVIARGTEACRAGLAKFLSERRSP